jgi:hypothetical protein
MLMPVRAAGALMLASLILPLCTRAQAPAPHVDAAKMQAAAHVMAAEHALAPESAASAAERAQQLEQRALRLRTEADQLQASAAHSEPPFAASLLKTAQDKRIQAQKLESEASQLRQAIRDAAAKADKLATGGGLPGKGLPQEVEHAIAPPIPLPIQPAGGTGAAPPTVELQKPAPPPPPPPSPPATHEAAPAPSPAPPGAAADFAAEATQVGELVTGSAAVAAPASGKVGTPFSVYLRVSPDKLQSLLRSLKADHPEDTTLKGKEGVKLAPEMIASVTGFDFDVSPPGDQTQAVSSTDATTWSWEINPTRAGVIKLNFALYGTLYVNGKPLPRKLYDYQQAVQVAISPAGFIEQNWQWLVTTLALPAIGAAWAFFRRSRNATGEPRRPGLAGKRGRAG